MAYFENAVERGCPWGWRVASRPQIDRGSSVSPEHGLERQSPSDALNPWHRILASVETTAGGSMRLRPRRPIAPDGPPLGAPTPVGENPRAIAQGTRAIRSRNRPRDRSPDPGRAASAGDPWEADFAALIDRPGSTTVSPAPSESRIGALAHDFFAGCPVHAESQDAMRGDGNAPRGSRSHFCSDDAAVETIPTVLLSVGERRRDSIASLPQRTDRALTRASPGRSVVPGHRLVSQNGQFP